MKAAFIGLGSMGRGMARNLLRAGHELTVWNRTRANAEELAGAGARLAANPAEAAASGLVVTMLADDRAVEQVVFGEHGLAAGLPRGGIHVSMSTISVALSRRLTEEHSRRGQVFVAAPVFGRPEAAEAAKLFVVAAGPREAVERCRPVFEALGQKTFEVGDEPVRANAIKLAGNFLIVCMLESLGEGFALTRKYDIAPEQFLEVVTAVFPAPVYQNYGALIAQQKYEPAGFRLRLGLKDIRLALAAAEEVRAPMPFASVARDNALSGMAQGWGDKDWSVLGQLAAERAGLK